MAPESGVCDSCSHHGQCLEGRWILVHNIPRGLQGISQEYYEASRIDGANKWHQFKSITLPLLSPTTFYALIITIINSFQVFDQIWIMTSGEPTADLVPVMVTEIYKNSFQYQKMGYATALSWILFLIIIAVTIFQNIMQKKWVHYE